LHWYSSTGAIVRGYSVKLLTLNEGEIFHAKPMNPNYSPTQKKSYFDYSEASDEELQTMLYNENKYNGKVIEVISDILEERRKLTKRPMETKELIVDKINWLAGQAPKFPFKCSAVIRYRHPEESCIIKKSKFGLKVIFSKPQRAITPGQSVVFYKKKELLGGGIIK